MADSLRNLASAPFLLGDWLIEPTLNRASRDKQSIAIENKSMDVLVFLASRPGDVVSADEVIEAVWQNRPMGENPVYKSVANLRKALGDTAKSPLYIETIPRRGYRVVAVVQPVDQVAPPSAIMQASSRRRTMLLVALMAAVALGIYWAASNRPNNSPINAIAAGNSIAVLPFENLTGDADNEFFCSGIAEELLNRLANIPSLRVVARESTFAFPALVQDFGEFADRVGVQYLLTGSVRQDDSTLRIAARLLNADGTLIWSGSYDREVDRVFAMQNDVADAVVNEMTLEVADSFMTQNAPTTNSDAYTAYLLGKEFQNRRSPDWRNKTISAFEEAIRLDSKFAAPYAALAATHLSVPLPTDEGLRAARALIDTALQLDPDLAEAHEAAGLFEMQFSVSPDYESARTHLRRALELNSSLIRARSLLAGNLRMTGEHQTALRVLEEAVNIDPLNSRLNLNLGIQYRADGQFDAARAQMSKVLNYPDVPAYAWPWLADLEKGTGRFDLAIDWLRKGIAAGTLAGDDTRWEAGVIAAAYADLGMFDAANRWLTQLNIAPGSPWRLSYQYVALSMQSKYTELAEEVELYEDARTDDSLSSVWGSSMIGSYLVRVGKYDEAIRVMAPTFANGIPFYNGPGGSTEIFDTLQNLGVAYQKTGDEQEANRLLLLALDKQQNLRQGRTRLRGLSLAREAATYSLLGQHELAVERLEAAAEAGWRNYYFARSNPSFGALFADPKGAVIFAEIKRDIDIQRERVIAEERLHPFNFPASYGQPE